PTIPSPSLRSLFHLVRGLFRLRLRLVFASPNPCPTGYSCRTVKRVVQQCMDSNTVGPTPFSLSTLRISSLSLSDEEVLKGNEHLVVSCTLNNQSNKIRFNA